MFNSLNLEHQKAGSGDDTDRFKERECNIEQERTETDKPVGWPGTRCP